MKYRKKPVVIEAVQLLKTKESIAEVFSFMFVQKETISIVRDVLINAEYHKACQNNGIIIHTLEGDMLASFGDYIIKGIDGEFYPCKPDIFEKTYDKVEND